MTKKIDQDTNKKLCAEFTNTFHEWSSKEPELHENLSKKLASYAQKLGPHETLDCLIKIQPKNEGQALLRAIASNEMFIATMNLRDLFSNQNCDFQPSKQYEERSKLFFARLAKDSNKLTI